jgi:GNAT superfamily N-acetyltransferase
MFTVRVLNWPEDSTSVCSIDASFSTDLIYQIESTGLSFSLKPAAAAPAFHKSFDLRELTCPAASDCHYLVAESDGVIFGVAAADFESWNRRATLRHLYVSRPYRNQGVGVKLLDGMIAYARTTNARCLWVETQNTNYHAVQFYRRRGFQLIGLDLSLYDPQTVDEREVALYFARDL